MKFWDSSALVPLMAEEANSRACRDLYRADPRVIVWQHTVAEVVSADASDARVRRRSTKRSS